MPNITKEQVQSTCSLVIAIPNRYMSGSGKWFLDLEKVF